jgi:hypothetical protein
MSEVQQRDAVEEHGGSAPNGATTQADSLADPLLQYQLQDPLLAPAAVQMSGGQPQDGTPGRPRQSVDNTPADGTRATSGQSVAPAAGDSAPAAPIQDGTVAPPEQTNAPAPATPAPVDAPRMPPPNLSAQLPVLMADIESRLRTDAAGEAQNIRAVYAEIVNRMHQRLGGELSLAESAIAASRQALATTTIATSGDAIQRRIKALCELRALTGHIRLGRIYLMKFGEAAGGGPAAIRGWMPGVRLFYSEKYAPIVLTNAVSQIIDHKAEIGRFQRGQEQIVEETLQEIRGVLKTLAKPFFVALLKAKGVNEKLAGLAFDLAWDFLGEVVGNQLILKGQVDWEEVSDKLFWKFVIHLTSTFVSVLTDKLNARIGDQMEGPELAKKVTQLIVEMGIDVPVEVVKTIAEEVEKTGDLGTALTNVFTPETIGNNIQKYLTDKNWEKLIGIKLG